MTPRYITIHASATPRNVDYGASHIDSWHRQRGWKEIGYHFVIRLDGSIEKGRSIHTQGAHVQGHNKDNIGICLIGGLNASGNPSDTFTEEQWGSLSFLLKHLTDTFGIVSEDIKGHRDWPNVKKDCPCFNVKDKLGYLLK